MTYSFKAIMSILYHLIILLLGNMDSEHRNIYKGKVAELQSKERTMGR